jgi:hypothetical protein
MVFIAMNILLPYPGFFVPGFCNVIYFAHNDSTKDAVLMI